MANAGSHHTCNCGHDHNGASRQAATSFAQHKNHRGADKVQVGKFTIQPAGTMYLRKGDLVGDNVVLVPLTHNYKQVLDAGHDYHVVEHFLPDFGGVLPDWEEFLRGTVVPLLEQGKTVVPFCMASHGRTGTFIASLISILESPEETPDPIQAARERHCHEAVETMKQATAIFALRQESVPEQWHGKLIP